MKVIDRIHTPDGAVCPAINFDDAEMDLYRGSGWKFAKFIDGRLAGLFSPRDMPAGDDVSAIIAAAIDWARRDDVWFGMCSCGQFCEPMKFDQTDALTIAKIARRISMENGL